MEITATMNLAELLFILIIGIVLSGIAVPNFLDARESLLWTRQQWHLNGDYLARVKVAETTMLLDRARVVQLSVFLVIGIFFATQSSPPITWKTWILYGGMTVVALSIALAAVRQRRMRTFVLEELRLKREQMQPNS